MRRWLALPHLQQLPTPPANTSSIGIHWLVPPYTYPLLVFHHHGYRCPPIHPLPAVTIGTVDGNG
uniref:Uncharacterized protein n=1 Tax=Arundo donax TaxID=35708 RepID=A0A0A9B5U5_ARUDO